jgi:guanylate kinase
LIGIVGPCSAGKSTLINGLKDNGIQAKHIAQEHSYVPDMWKRIGKPGILIYLDVSYLISMKRRRMDMGEKEFSEQVERLTHAKDHADLYLNTDILTPSEVLTQVLEFLRGNNEFLL